MLHSPVYQRNAGNHKNTWMMMPELFSHSRFIRVKSCVVIKSIFLHDRSSGAIDAHPNQLDSLALTQTPNLTPKPPHMISRYPIFSPSAPNISPGHRKPLHCTCLHRFPSSIVDIRLQLPADHGWDAMLQPNISEERIVAFLV